MDIIALINLTGIAIGIVLASSGFSVRRGVLAATQKIMSDPMIDQQVKREFQTIIGHTTRTVYLTYYSVVAAFIVMSIIVMVLISELLARGAASTLIGAVVFISVFCCAGILAPVICLGFLFGQLRCSRQVYCYLYEASTDNPEIKLYASALADVQLSAPEAGLRAAALVGILSGGIMGLAWVVVLFLMTNQAVACARSSKCL